MNEQRLLNLRPESRFSPRHTASRSCRLATEHSALILYTNFPPHFPHVRPGQIVRFK
jgi:hypothetical protein